MENEWIVIEIDLPGAGVDVCCAMLAQFDCLGTLVEERSLDCFVVPEDELDPEKTYRLKAYFPKTPDPEGFREQIRSTLAAVLDCRDGLVVASPAPVNNEDWAENWKQHFSCQRVGSRLVVRPSWESYVPQAGDVVIELDPGMAFGTGSHETTMLCLEQVVELLEGANSPGSLLDVGTGSGILALGAAALGCPTILANDIDPQACQVARENAKKNGLSGRIEITEKPLEELPGQFELVIANILAEENVRLKDELLRHLLPGGCLVMSGILREKEGLVRSGFADLPVEFIASRYRNDWVCLVYRRN